ncbi:phosphatidylinositol 4,5-bisphosphate 5-phosphatase A isoform X2 [Rhinatrema bivittatum]|nr:phosphatidylinositol 4,5-bisphosphate 5-phosphatase A isoform X2 [Rhinatrema bivittatum]XP_029427095.1 phosphatidylinositol 4,5-bisphosphate 5-phosphatase A isoform X2 [Rhinatrema bivittatum]XP_029427096.1 phosphatidylinositol 4,5-bisphosphate 5-phosphatase A isoform X2 [Rhinatrema bivittatum]XP_029427097.1 phosphatidylinositol 4,5-bisphosphate 5-phosphatase A isoform X2 [Rhinatrema bivittatum]XP_029427098.1 phosphatidylinositol 4,5-bisphosphate 5-phosphatase A isoform X2 [Rhinatrema bivitta
MEPTQQVNKILGSTASEVATDKASIKAPSPVPRITPVGSIRSQPEGSSGSNAVHLGGPVSLGTIGFRPISPVGSFPSASDRFQPEGSQNVGPEDRILIALSQPLSGETSRSQPEGSGGSHTLSPPGLLSPVQYRSLPSPSGSPSVPPDGSPLSSPRGSPSMHFCGSPLPTSGNSLSASVSKLLSLGSEGSLSRSESTESFPHGRNRLSPNPFDGSVCAEPSDTIPTEPDGSSPDEDFRITIVTWNVGAAVPPSDITSLLCLNAGDGKTDMFVIGLQEVNSMINKRLKDALFTDQWSEVFMDVLSPFSYVLVTTVRMQGVLLLVFAKYYHLPFLRHVQTDCTRTGLGGYWGNKGGVSVRLALFGHMVCFLNCHLPAHMENSDQRMDNFESILQLQQFEGPLANGVLDHDVVFWFGDLNFRIEDFDMHFVKYAIDNNKLSLLWEKDQLNMAKNIEPVLSGFLEGALKFPPTYKFDVGTNTYDTSAKKRKPAWTDRILWKMKTVGSPCLSQSPSGRRRSSMHTAGGVTVTQLCYRSHMQYTESDHKPVSASFSMKFSYKADVPLVQILVADEWCKASDAIVRFSMAPTFPKSSWDWIGLYKVGFRHHKDYVAYVWAKHEEELDGVKHPYQVAFNEDSLPRGTSEYILGYYSNNLGTLIGVTEPFQISLPGSEPDSNSPSDSSDSSSEEDDSTLVLLRPKSRSPSPGKMKQRRSRSPALAKFHELILMPSSREKSKSRSPSPRGSKSPNQEAPRSHLGFEQNQSRRTSSKDHAAPIMAKGNGKRSLESLMMWNDHPGNLEAGQPILVPPVRPAAVGQAEGQREMQGCPDLHGRTDSKLQGTQSLGGISPSYPRELLPTPTINKRLDSN